MFQVMRTRPYIAVLLTAAILTTWLTAFAAPPQKMTPGPIPTPEGLFPLPAIIPLAAPTKQPVPDALSSPSPGEEAPPVSPAVEGRGIWVEMKTLPADAEGIRQVVRKLAYCNFNFLLLEVTYEGTTLYPGPYQDPRFHGLDPLAIVVKEAHRNNMEVHVWMWCLKQARWRDRDPQAGGPLLAQHPEWAAVNALGQKVAAGGAYYWLCPSRPDTREFIVSQLEALARDYAIDGVHLDYIRFERTLVKGAPPPLCLCDHCRAEYMKTGHPDPINIQPATSEFRDWMRWRETLITSLVAEISLRVKTVRPEVLVSAAVYPDPAEARRYFSQDWPLWVSNGWLDFVTPMLYRDQTEGFARRIEQYVTDRLTAQRVLLPGVGVNRIQTRIFSHDVLIEQVMAARRQGMLGNVIFSYSVLAPYFEEFLRERVYQRPARVPFRDEADAARRLADQAGTMRAHATSEDGIREANWLQARAADLGAIARFRAPDGASFAEDALPPMPLTAHVGPMPHTAITRLHHAPVIDGSLSDEAWRTVRPLPLGVMENGFVAEKGTWAKLAVDKENLYVAFHCADSHISDTIERARHESQPWFEDHVAVFLDPGPTRSQYLVLRLSPLGRMALEKVPDGHNRPSGVGTPENVPDTLQWEGRVRCGETFWNAEYRIPLSELFSLHPGEQTMGLNLIRVHRAGKRRHYDEWSSTCGTQYDPLRFGTAVLPHE